MKVRIFAATAQHQVVTFVENERSPTEDFLFFGEKSTLVSREGLVVFLQMAAELGLSKLPAAWFHEVDKRNKIFEFVKGDLRLFFFRGQGKQLVVCTTGIRKKTQKVDRLSIQKAINIRNRYEQAVRRNTLEVDTNGTR